MRDVVVFVFLGMSVINTSIRFDINTVPKKGHLNAKLALPNKFKNFAERRRK